MLIIKEDSKPYIDRGSNPVIDTRIKDGVEYIGYIPSSIIFFRTYYLNLYLFKIKLYESLVIKNWFTIITPTSPLILKNNYFYNNTSYKLN